MEYIELQSDIQLKKLAVSFSQTSISSLLPKGNKRTTPQFTTRSLLFSSMSISEWLLPRMKHGKINISPKISDEHWESSLGMATMGPAWGVSSTAARSNIPPALCLCCSVFYVLIKKCINKFFVTYTYINSNIHSICSPRQFPFAQRGPNKPKGWRGVLDLQTDILTHTTLLFTAGMAPWWSHFWSHSLWAGYASSIRCCPAV